MPEEKTEFEVEDCENWLEIFMTQGGHCYNCANRDGYPMRARPSDGCTNFERTVHETLREED